MSKKTLPIGGPNGENTRLGMGSSYTAYIVETFVTLAIVCGLAYAVLFGARRLGVGRARGPSELVGQLPLDARRFIYLVKVGEQVYVVGAGEGGFTKLGEIGAADLPAEKRTDAFAAILARMGRGGAARATSQPPPPDDDAGGPN